MVDFNSLIFPMSLFVFGVVLIILTINAQQQLPKECATSNVNISLNIMLMLGVMLIVIPITFFLCQKYCASCNMSGMWYKLVFGGIGIVLAICGGIVWNGTKDCSVSSVTRYGLIMMIIGILLPVILTFYNYRTDIIEMVSKNSSLQSEASSEISSTDVSSQPVITPQKLPKKLKLDF